MKITIFRMMYVTAIIAMICAIYVKKQRPRLGATTVNRHISQDQGKAVAGRYDNLVYSKTTIFGKAIGDCYSAKVIRVINAGTLEIVKADKTTKVVRLESIAPPVSGTEDDLGQPFAKEATLAAKIMMLGHTVTVYQTGIDGDLRPHVFICLQNGANANAKLVRQGWAWHSILENSDKTLAALQELAKQEKRGLWVDEGPISPWLFLSEEQESK